MDTYEKCISGTREIKAEQEKRSTILYLPPLPCFFVLQKLPHTEGPTFWPTELLTPPPTNPVALEQRAKSLSGNSLSLSAHPMLYTSVHSSMPCYRDTSLLNTYASTDNLDLLYYHKFRLNNFTKTSCSCGLICSIFYP